MVKPILVDAQIYSFGSRPGRSSRLVFELNEVKDMTAGYLLNLAGKQSFCYIAIKEEPFTAQDVEALQQERADFEMKGKTPAQRLRGVLYHVWQQNAEDMTFNDFYTRTMEKIINHYKEKLP